MHDGANQLPGSDYSLIDYNRAGVPLLEVVSEPDMRSGAEAVAYASELRRMMCFMGLSEGIMAQGHMRFDVNVSVSGSCCRPRMLCPLTSALPVVSSDVHLQM